MLCPYALTQPCAVPLHIPALYPCTVMCSGPAQPALRVCPRPRLRPCAFPANRAVDVRLRPVAFSAQPPGPPQPDAASPALQASAPPTTSHGLRRPIGVRPPRPRPPGSGAHGQNAPPAPAPARPRPNGRYSSSGSRSRAPTLPCGARHPRGRRDPRRPTSTPPCHQVPTPRYRGPQRGPRRPNTGEPGRRGIDHTYSLPPPPPYAAFRTGSSPLPCRGGEEARSKGSRGPAGPRTGGPSRPPPIPPPSLTGARALPPQRGREHGSHIQVVPPSATRAPLPPRTEGGTPPPPSPSRPTQTLGPVTLTWCEGPTVLRTAPTDRKRGATRHSTDGSTKQGARVHYYQCQ